ncbi:MULTISPECIES: DUF3078 domain-containing protein [Reichenbachiella]|uniref:DUF3078 domain-containing protein n=1 Tax=Reichenbachiella TaxID=156993 RepID=UPI000E6D08B5|nr:MULTISPECIES: DUF3078 domain-containing protein [Reichenbachiella]MBU2915095.1 DUF3078 domain-containing protein [Reichenbachiella agariperforans]RJE70521.1 hypothetical protein BGP76_10565 [Reichenbachiella sp. MSK19-1]
MKKIILTLILIAPLLVQAQSDTTYWNKGGNVGLTFNQATLKNWAAGGINTYSGGAYFFQFFDYKKEGVFWQNTIDLGFGFIKEDKVDSKKADDRLVITSQYGKEMGEGKWYYSAMVDFRTQFAPGYDDPEQNNKISSFMSPGYLLASVGADYKPNDNFSASFGLLSGKMTFVMDDDLADAGAYGVDAAETDGTGAIIAGTGKNMRAEFGATIKINYNKEIFKNTTYSTNLLLFTNYMENTDKIDVNWENTLTMKVNDFLSAMVYIQTIYDYDIKFYDLDGAGEPILSTEEARWQFKSILSLGLSYKFGGTRG